MASPMPRANQCETTFAPRPDCKLTLPLVAHACTRCYPRRFHEASRTRLAGARLRSVGIADSEGTRGDPNVASTPGRFSSPLGRKPIAHGASRGRTGTFTKPRHGAKVAALPSSAPSGGCFAHGSFPRLAPWAIGFRPNGLEKLPCILATFGSLRVSPESRIPPLYRTPQAVFELFGALLNWYSPCHCRKSSRPKGT